MDLFEKGDFVYNIKPSKLLTINNRYKVNSVIRGKHRGSGIVYINVYVINDLGVEMAFSSRRFIRCSEWREKQIEKLKL